jgi:YHS domain-containing protein
MGVRFLALGLMYAAATAPAARGQLAFRPPAHAGRAAEQDAGAPPVAAGGYCVVSLRDAREWRPGAPPFGVQFDGRQYWFAGQRELEIFVAAPAVYAPVLSGDCVVTYAQTRQRVRGLPQFGAVQGGRVYFFASDAQRAKFVAAPQAYAEADVADGGRCLVTRVDKHREVAGRPEATVLVGGLRRFFAGAYERSLYLADPQRYNAASESPGTPSPAGPAVASTPIEPGGGAWRVAATPDQTPHAAEAKPVQAAAPEVHGGSDEILSDPVMGGYCPVTLRQRNMWVRGRYDDVATIENMVFLTAGPAERDALLADPAPYIPALGGYCVVSFADRGEKTKGSVFHATRYQGRLFLFADADAKDTFNAMPARYASIDLAAGGACVVTLAETGQSTPGFAEIAVWHDGLLYRFANAEQKAKFLATPDKYAPASGAYSPSAPPATRAPAALAPSSDGRR